MARNEVLSKIEGDINIESHIDLCDNNKIYVGWKPTTKDLFSENWLTSKQQSQFNIYEGVTITREKIETLCPDQIVLDFIFKEKEIKIDNIQYRVHHGTTVFLETFNETLPIYGIFLSIKCHI